MQASTDKWERHVSRVSLIERFDCVLYPVDLAALFGRLPETGWIVPRLVEEGEAFRVPEAPSKANVQLRFDQGNKTIGVTSSKDLSETLTAFAEIRGLAREVSDFTPLVRTHYVEFRYIGWLKGHSDPLGVFASWWTGNERTAHLGRLLQTHLLSEDAIGPYGLRFASGGHDANHPNWAELQIAPVSIAGHRRYSFDLIFRNEDFAVVQRVAEAADGILDATLAELERRR